MKGLSLSTLVVFGLTLSFPALAHAQGSEDQDPIHGIHHRPIGEFITECIKQRMTVRTLQARIIFTRKDSGMSVPDRTVGTLYMRTERGADLKDRTEMSVRLHTPGRNDEPRKLVRRIWHKDGLLIITDEKKKRYRSADVRRKRSSSWEPISFVLFGLVPDIPKTYEVRILQDAKFVADHIPKDRQTHVMNLRTKKKGNLRATSSVRLVMEKDRCLVTRISALHEDRSRTIIEISEFKTEIEDETAFQAAFERNLSGLTDEADLAASRRRKPPTLQVTRAEVKKTRSGQVIEVDFDTTLPRKAVVTLEAGRARFVYYYEDDKFVWTPPERSFSDKQAYVNRDGKDGLKLNLRTRGIYRVRVRFDPGAQKRPKLMRARMGKDHFHTYIFDDRVMEVGINDAAFKELAEDVRECDRTLRRAEKLIAELVDVADKGGDGWETRALAIIKNVERVQDGISRRNRHSLLEATYGFLAEFLRNVGKSKALINAFLYARKQAQKEGSGDLPSPSTWEDTGDPSGGHRDDPDDRPPPGDDVAGGMVSFAKMNEQVARGQRIYRRESLLLAVHFSRLELEALTLVAAKIRNGEQFKNHERHLQSIGRAFKRLDEFVKSFRGDAMFEKLCEVRGERNFAEVPADLSRHFRRLSNRLEEGTFGENESDGIRESREELERALDKFMRKLAEEKKPEKKEPEEKKNP